eukprot:gene503-796_t
MRVVFFLSLAEVILAKRVCEEDSTKSFLQRRQVPANNSKDGRSYVGCFVNEAGGELQKEAKGPSQMSPRLCHSMCRKSAEAEFFWINQGRDCYCGADANLKAKGACEQRCVGDDSEICGSMGQEASVYHMSSCGKDIHAEREQIIPVNRKKAVESVAFTFSGHGPELFKFLGRVWITVASVTGAATHYDLPARLFLLRFVFMLLFVLTWGFSWAKLTSDFAKQMHDFSGELRMGIDGIQNFRDMMVSVIDQIPVADLRDTIKGEMRDVVGSLDQCSYGLDDLDAGVGNLLGAEEDYKIEEFTNNAITLKSDAVTACEELKDESSPETVPIRREEYQAQFPPPSSVQTKATWGVHACQPLQKAITCCAELPLPDSLKESSTDSRQLLVAVFDMWCPNFRMALTRRWARSFPTHFFSQCAAAQEVGADQELPPPEDVNHVPTLQEFEQWSTNAKKKWSTPTAEVYDQMVATHNNPGEFGYFFNGEVMSTYYGGELDFPVARACYKAMGVENALAANVVVVAGQVGVCVLYKSVDSVHWMRSVDPSVYVAGFSFEHKMDVLTANPDTNPSWDFSAFV